MNNEQSTTTQPPAAQDAGGWFAAMARHPGLGWFCGQANNLDPAQARVRLNRAEARAWASALWRDKDAEHPDTPDAARRMAIWSRGNLLHFSATGGPIMLGPWLAPQECYELPAPVIAWDRIEPCPPGHPAGVLLRRDGYGIVCHRDADHLGGGYWESGSDEHNPHHSLVETLYKAADARRSAASDAVRVVRIRVSWMFAPTDLGGAPKHGERAPWSKEAGLFDADASYALIHQAPDGSWPLVAHPDCLRQLNPVHPAHAQAAAARQHYLDTQPDTDPKSVAVARFARTRAYCGPAIAR